MADGDREEPRERIARVLDFPTSFDTPTFTAWKREMADAVLDALRLEQVGWAPSAWMPVSDDTYIFLRGDTNPAEMIGCEPVYRLGATDG